MNSSSISYFSQQIVCVCTYVWPWPMTCSCCFWMIEKRPQYNLQIHTLTNNSNNQHTMGLSQDWSEIRNVSATWWHCFPTLLHNLEETEFMYVCMYVCTWFLQGWLLDLSLVLTQINCYYCVLVQAFHSSPIHKKKRPTHILKHTEAHFSASTGASTAFLKSSFQLQWLPFLLSSCFSTAANEILITPCF